MDNANDSKILPANTKQALQKMILITEEAIAAFQQETNAVAVGDDVEFYQISKIKTNINQLYKAAAQEFLARKEEFLTSGDIKLHTLADLQKQLGSEALVNMQFLDPIRKKAQTA